MVGTYFDLQEGRSEEEKCQAFLDLQRTKGKGWYQMKMSDARTIPGSPLAYWTTATVRESFTSPETVGEIADPKVGMASSDNGRFLRLWHEVSWNNIGLAFEDATSAAESGLKWFPYNKGGSFRRWFGNNYYVINWLNDGEEIKEAVVNNPRDPNTTHWSRRIFNTDSFFKSALTWSLVSSSDLSVRLAGAGFLFDVGGSSAFPPAKDARLILGLLNSELSKIYLKIFNPTLNFQPGNLGAIPADRRRLSLIQDDVELLVDEAVTTSRADWDNFETSWDFRDQPFLRNYEVRMMSDEGVQNSFVIKGRTLAESWASWKAYCTATIRRMQELETENNRLFIAAYGLDGELEPTVPEEQITLARAEARCDMAAFLSYAVGCMMGRYSLDVPGLILANAGDTVEEYLRIVAEKRANTVASGENHESEQLKRSHRVAESHAAGEEGLPGYEAVSEGGALRTDESASSGSGVGSVEHSGGAGKTGHSGVQKLSVDSPGISGGSGDAAVDCSGPELPLRFGNEEDTPDSHRSGQDAQWAPQKSGSQSLATSHQPLTLNPVTSHLSFAPDEDAIVPVLDGEWFEDDIVARTREFLRVTFGEATLNENLRFIEQSLGKSLEKYFLADFYKDHVQTYKKRPIYWLFQSPKKGFSALVYLHRYNRDTVNLLLNNYLREFQNKLQNRKTHLNEILVSESTSARDKTSATKEAMKIDKTLIELADWERDVIYPLATQRLEIDLDDGVKQNCPKFGKALAKVPGLS